MHMTANIIAIIVAGIVFALIIFAAFRLKENIEEPDYFSDGNYIE